MSDSPSGPGLFDTFLLRDLASNTMRLILTRWVAGGLVPLATAFCVRGLGLPLPERPLYLVGAAILSYNGLFVWLVRRAVQTEDPAHLPYMRRLVVLQVALDWLAMAVFLHLTGGIESPALFFFLIHMLMVTILLPGQSPYLYVVIGTGVVLLISLLERTGLLPHYHILPSVPRTLYSDSIFIASRVVFFATTAFATVYLTASIMSRLRERERQVAALFEVTRAVSSTLSLPEVLDALVRSAAEALEVPAASLHLLDETGERLELSASYGVAHPERLKECLITLSESAMDREALAGQPVIVRDAASDPRVRCSVLLEDERFASLLVAPLIGRGGPLGVLRIYSRRPHRFMEEEADFAMAIARQGATALENALAHDALRRSEQTRAQFVRMVTHELRAPVAGAQSLLRVLVRGMAGELTDQQRDILRRLEDRLDALSALINDLLDLAASKTVQLEEPLRPVTLQPVLRAVIERYAAQAEEKRVALRADIPPEPLTVCASEDGLDRVFDNLIGNAVKYTPEGGRVSVHLSKQVASAVITVADTGIGIPEKDLPHLWEEFFRASNARRSRIPGTGLGLSIVRRLVEYYGGLIGVQSVEGQGTTFTVTLPLAGPGGCGPEEAGRGTPSPRPAPEG